MPGDEAGCGDTPELGRGDPAAGSARERVPSAPAAGRAGLWLITGPLGLLPAEPPRQSLPARGAPGARSAERVAHVTGPANHPEPLIALHVGTSLRTSKERGKS